MGLLGLTREIITEMKIDVSDHISGLKSLKGAITEQQKAELEAHEARNEQYESFTDKLNKVKVAMNAARELGEIIWDGYKEGLQEAKLETTALGVDIEGLSRAAGGLQTNLQLLEFAAKANSSAFHNTQEDMEVAERAIRKLEARGVPASEAIDAITNAVVSAKVKGLIPLGIAVDTHIDKLQTMGEENMTAAQKLQVHAAAMEELRKFTADTSDEQDNLGDSMQRSEVKLKNSWAELKIGLGQLVVAMQPLLEALAKAVGLVASLVDGSSSVYQSIGLDDAQRALRAKQAARSGHAEDAFSILTGKADYDQTLRSFMGGFLKGGGTPGQGGDGEIDMEAVDLRGGVRADRKDSAAAQRDREALARYNERLDREFDIWKRHHDKMVKDNSDNGQLGALAVENSADYEGAAFERIFEKQQRDRETNLTNNWRKETNAYEKNKENLVQRMFGSVDDVAVARDLFKGLTESVTSGYKAMVEGSQGFGEAFKGSVANMLEAEGAKMQILAIENSAQGLAALALGPIGGVSASQFFEAAALFEAGSIAAGVVASGLGAGGGRRASGSGGGYSSSAPQTYNNPNNQQHSGQQSIIYVYGDSFAEDSPYMRQLQAERTVGRVMHTSAGSIG